MPRYDTLIPRCLHVRCWQLFVCEIDLSLFSCHQNKVSISYHDHDFDRDRDRDLHYGMTCNVRQLFQNQQRLSAYSWKRLSAFSWKRLSAFSWKRLLAFNSCKGLSAFKDNTRIFTECDYAHPGDRTRGFCNHFYATFWATGIKLSISALRASRGSNSSFSTTTDVTWPVSCCCMRMYGCVCMWYMYIWFHVYVCMYDFMCMYVCMIHVYVCMYACMHVWFMCIYACMHVYIYIYICVCVYKCMYVCMYDSCVYMYVWFMCMYGCIYVCMYACMHVPFYYFRWVCMWKSYVYKYSYTHV